MSRRNQSPLPGKGVPLNSGAYSWTNSFSRGGSQMIGDANLSGKRKKKYAAQDRGAAIFALILIGGTLLVTLIMAIAELI